MGRQKHVERIWYGRESGLVVPEGIVSDLSLSYSQTYLQIKEKAAAVEKLYVEDNIPLPPSSDLAKLVAEAQALSDMWLIGRPEEIPISLLFRVGLFDRIAEAILPLLDVADQCKFLAALVSGTLDLLNRKRSNAKDVLWEIELWAILKRRSFDADLEEPPDIVVRFEETKVGIACKNLYSERHVQNVLSQALKQIEGGFDFGIVALNIENLLPPNHILRTPSQETLGQFINDLNIRFIRSHERHFRKYLASGRVISVLVSTAVLADVYRARTRFNNARQSTIWTIPGLPHDKDRELRKFYGRLMG